MQSFLQYRSFGRLLRNQIEHNRLRAGALNVTQDGSSSDLPAPAEPQSTDPSLTDKDLEKDLENASPRSGTEWTSPNSSGLPARERSPVEVDDDDPQTLRTIDTHQTTGTQLGISLTGIDVRSRTTNEGKELGKVFVVGYEGSNDPMNPHNWPFRTRVLATGNVGIIALVVGTAASIDSAVIPQASAYFGVSDVTEALATGIVSQTISANNLIYRFYTNRAL
jgi:hypothetical protein